MNLIIIISLLSTVFAMAVLSEIFKLKKEVRKLNKIAKHILDKNKSNKSQENEIEKA